VLTLVKAFLKAGVLTETRHHEDSFAGTPQGGILSPLAANIALAVLDEHVHGSWLDGGTMSTPGRRAPRRAKGLPNWRIVRYADDFVILVHGTRGDVEALHEQVAIVLQPLGLRLSSAKTRIVHMSESLDFLGFRIQWRRKRGTSKWYVYTFIADRPVRSLKDKVRALTNRLSQQPPRDVLIRLNQIMRRWANYFKHAIAQRVFAMLDRFAWRRVVRVMMVRYRLSWRALRRRLTDPTGRWKPIEANGIALRPIAAIPIVRYRYRGNAIPNPWTTSSTPTGMKLVESPLR
jgi:RNA-directed DNA polymerase